MLKKNIVTGALVALSGTLTATSALAEDKPWDLPKPAGMTEAHQESAIAARSVQERLSDGDFGYNPVQADWDWANGRNRTIPMSNMSVSALTSLLSGRYHIYSENGSDVWFVKYYAPDGKTHFCGYSDLGEEYNEWVLDRYVATAAFGMAGVFHWDPAGEDTPVPPIEDYVGWPVVVDGSRGLVFDYTWTGEDWFAQPGWIQDDYAAAFAENCPNLPRGSKVNDNQLGQNFGDLIREASPVRGTQTSFKNDPQDPMTASMYYWLNSPV